jgi:hypothetical protein
MLDFSTSEASDHIRNMDEQSMLPFNEMPIARSRRNETVDRPSHQKHRQSKPLAPGVAAALADPARVVFLDVETTGLSWYYDEITLVGWMHNGRYDFHIAGERAYSACRVVISPRSRAGCGSSARVGADRSKCSAGREPHARGDRAPAHGRRIRCLNARASH